MSDRTNAAEAETYDRVNDYISVSISLASPHDIRSWSFGEVKMPETINYRIYRPAKDGLFCERIFGPEKDWECTCGKFRGTKYKGTICDRCGVKVTHSRVRRKRMGHIELAAPVVHIWFFKAMPSRLGTLLDMKTSSLEKIIYFQDYVVIDPGETPLKERQVLTEDEYRQARADHGDAFEVGMGAEAIKTFLQKLNLVELSRDLRARLEKEQLRGEKASKQRVKDLVKRLKTVESLRDSSNKCEWMVLECIPVIPPDLRPLVLLDSGEFATSDLNDLYRRIINRNNRLKKLVDLDAPEVIIRNEKRMLQLSVDALFDNNRCKRQVLGSSNRPLKSLTDMIAGKHGRIRENLIGKRVDYSARSVIVVGPELKLHQCGLPKKIALELYRPFMIRRLVELDYADKIETAKKMLEEKDDPVWDAHKWDILKGVMANHPVLLNRVPTLHRMGIQAFEPVLIEGNAIRIHPLVCKGFNADFDGDQMAVHLPLSIEARVEAYVLMMATNNIFSPANGNPIITPSQDIVMGCYWLTASRGEEGEQVEASDGMKFHSSAEVFMAHAAGKLGLHARVQVRLPAGKKVISEVKNERGMTVVEEIRRKPNGMVRTTVGRVIFNDILPQRLPFYDLALTAEHLSRVVTDCYRISGQRAAVSHLDRVKEFGFREATRSGLSLGVGDLWTLADKASVIASGRKMSDAVRELYRRKLINETERDEGIGEAWAAADDALVERLASDLAADRRPDATDQPAPHPNPLGLMARSGVRGGYGPLVRLLGMRGLVSRPGGGVAATVVTSCYREGLPALDYFFTIPAARKEAADAKTLPARAGHLCRELVEVAQDTVVTVHDCGTASGFTVPVASAARGRVSRAEIRHPITGRVVIGVGELVTPEMATELMAAGSDTISVRSPLTCDAPLGVCRLCYGADLATGALVEEGAAVGVVAAQSLGEPVTQLTLRRSHSGRAAGSLSRLVDLFEARRPAGMAVLAEANGRVRLNDPIPDLGTKWVAPPCWEGEPEQPVPIRSGLLVGIGDEAGGVEPLTDDLPVPGELNRARSAEAVRLVAEVRSVYLDLGLDVDSKHVEVIVSRMLQTVEVIVSGQSGLLPGTIISRAEFLATNRQLVDDYVTVADPADSTFVPGQVLSRAEFEAYRAVAVSGGERVPTVAPPVEARCRPVLQGVTPAGMRSNSFIRAAGFEQTVRVLIDAALASKVDYLVGLKENVMMRRLIPAGTGFKAHQDAEARIKPSVGPGHGDDSTRYEVRDYQPTEQPSVNVNVSILPAAHVSAEDHQSPQAPPPPPPTIRCPGTLFRQGETVDGWREWIKVGDSPMSVPPPGGEYLFVVYPNATDSEMIQLSDLKIISGLREVSLADCHGLTDIGFKHLPPLPELRILRLDGCAGITETGLSAAVTAAPNLRGLGLRDCRQLTDRWLREVCRLKGLGDLTLTGCRVISDIASSLGEAGVTRAGLERVKVILPGCRIHGAEG